MSRIRKEFDAHLYPEDMHIRPAADKFHKENLKYDPYIYPGEEGEFDRETTPEIAPEDKEYGEYMHGNATISVADSKKFGGD